MQIELSEAQNRPWAVAQARYTSENSYMVDSRPARQNYGYGIKFFEGRPVDDLALFNGENVTVEELRSTYRVWRPEETVEAAHALKEHGRVLVVGRPQSGKGTIVFGMSEICDKQGYGYLMIDGHWQDAPAEMVVDAINKAQTEGKMIFFDSFDYLFAGSSKLRKYSKPVIAERTGKIVDALSATTVPLVLTRHDDFWADLVIDKDLVNSHQDFLQTVGVYDLPRYIESEESRLAFLVDHEYNINEAYSLLQIPDLPLVKDVVAAKIGDNKYLDDVRLALKDYGVLKRLARSEGEITKKLVEEINSGDENAILEFVHMVIGIHLESDLAATLRWQK